MGDKPAFEIIGSPLSDGPFLFSCEHASNRVPLGLQASGGDRHLLDDHWGWDIGAAALVSELVDVLGGQGVASTFSRLVIDANRPPSADSLIVGAIDGQSISFNQAVDDAERRRRVDEYFEPYHQAVTSVGRERAARTSPFHVISIHSFTPVYRGRQRDMEIGVLFDDFDDDAERVGGALAGVGFKAALNEPYSGRGPGALIYAAARHGNALGRKYLELEIRQDLIADGAGQRDTAQRIAKALSVFAPESTHD